ncbi:MAG: hypothetical protein L6V84_03110 [Oscillospiraceae bacterium]|nr:MAG: hypothetical protein L6V84_03110 [Oscillospiraceae bacterium]
MRTGAAIEAVGLTKEYRSRGRTVRAVDGLNLSVGAGEFFSLLGVNRGGQNHRYQDAVLPDAPDGGYGDAGRL